MRVVSIDVTAGAGGCSTVHLIDDDPHLLWVSQYIAANPERRPWPYSSSDARFSFVDTTVLADAFGSEQRWREFASHP